MPLAYSYGEASYAERVADKPLVRVASPFGRREGFTLRYVRHRLTPLDASPLKSADPPTRLAPLLGETL